MSHDFEIRVKNAPTYTKKVKYKTYYPKFGIWKECEREQQSIQDEYQAYFFGFAEGILYKAFGMENHCMGCSGDNEEITLDRNTAIKGITKAIELFYQLDYPDPNRIDELKVFHQKMLNEFKDYKEYIICYS